ncbi:DUF3883 domain-containing protein [Microbispora amethystogenes]|uniref:protein NO VEIN domain-containing protein n=1 Tax=Microbispora amethystogenes TaxID=1427754 RepID=UPI0033E11927
MTGDRDHIRDTPRHPRFLQDAKLRRVIERHAVSRATRYLESLGYTVTDVGDRCSYDLHICRGSETLRVEVKGSTVDVDSVELTVNEVDNADGVSSILIVVDGISLSFEDGLHTPDGGRLRAWWSWRPAAEDLSATRYRYRLSGAPTYAE